MIQLAIAVFAVGAPVIPYWIYRVRVMRIFFIPIRHILQISGISALSITLFLFLVKVETRLSTSIFILVLSSLLAAFEIFLRRVQPKSGLERIDIKYGNGRNGLQVSYDEAREASGDYPRHYMTESYYDSMRVSGIELNPQNNIKKMSKKSGVHYGDSPNFCASEISVENGIRTTTDQPTQWNRNLLLFGGSTTFGDREVPDDLTYSSYLQRIINNNSHCIRVINHGKQGASVINRLKWLIEETPTNIGDIIVFYFGDNDSGWIVNGKSHFTFRSPLLIITSKLLGLRLEILNWLHGELVYLHNKWCADCAFKKTVSELERAKKWADNHDLRFLVVLQPNLFVSKVISKYENSLRGRFSFFLRSQIEIAYPRYEEFVKHCGYGLSFTEIFNNREYSVFLDWAHVNARGNEIIADNLFCEIKKLRLL